MTKPATQKAILNSGDSKASSDIKSKSTAGRKISKSRKRTSIDEFAIRNNLRPEVKAGFKAWLKGEYYHFDNEWQKLFEEYSNR